MVDDAGLFPPAALDPEPAVRRHFEFLGGPGGRMLNRFVVPANLAAGVAKEAESNRGELNLAVVLPSDSTQWREAWSACAPCHGWVDSLEFRVTSAAEVVAVKKLLAQLKGHPAQLYAEVPFGPDQGELLFMLGGLDEDLGIKARLAGATPGAVPGVEDLAGWIREAAAMEVPFKFTAGLHRAIRMHDPQAGEVRHGFLNVLVASAAAVALEVNRNQIADILSRTEGSAFEWGDAGVRVGEFRLDLADLDQLSGVCGGFGSCSLEEPLGDLRAMGWVPG